MTDLGPSSPLERVMDLAKARGLEMDSETRLDSGMVKELEKEMDSVRERAMDLATQQ